MTQAPASDDFDHGTPVDLPDVPSFEEEAAEVPYVSPGQKAQTLRQLAAFQLAHGAPGLADQLASIAVWLDPEDPANLRLRAHTMARTGQPAAGLKLLMDARKRSGQLGVGDWMAVGLAFARGGDMKGARRFLLREDD